MAPVHSNVRSSLVLEILLWLHTRFSVLFFLLIVGIYLYKLSFLAYPLHVQLAELVILILFPAVEALRIAWAHRGNLTETPAYLFFSLALCICAGGMAAYLAWFQAYVLWVEVVVGAVQLGWVAVEALVELITIAGFTAAITTTAAGGTSVPASR